jgi:hypothetical protein
MDWVLTSEIGILLVRQILKGVEMCHLGDAPRFLCGVLLLVTMNAKPAEPKQRGDLDRV